MTAKVLGLINANVITLNDRLPVCEAILVEGQQISALGASFEIQQACLSKNGELIDLHGQTVLPGLHDCHVHLMSTGLNSLGIDLYDCGSLDDIFDLIRQASRTYPLERWIFGRRLDESRLHEKRPPTAAELDRVAPQHVVYLSDRGLHYTLINSRGFEVLGIAKDTAGVRRLPDGTASGRLHEEANNQAKRAFFERQDRTARRAALQYTTEMAVRKGVTSVHAVEGGELFSDADIPVILEEQENLPVHIVLYWSTKDLAKIQAAGLPRMGGDILLDGSIGSRTAAFFAPYSDEPSTSGLLYNSDEEVEDMITRAHLANVQISFHAIGEKAIAQGLDCFERVLAKYPRTDHRHRLEHFGFPRVNDIARAAQLGLVISTQPAFTYLRGGPGSVYNQRLGDTRERFAYPLRSLLDAGLTVNGGSDSDVTPIDPLLGIHACVNPPYPEHALRVEEALRLFTMDAARTAFEEHHKGTLEPGKLADLTVLGGDPCKSPGEAIKDIPIMMTIKAGKIVYQQ
jgi:predicted amidohydrolase YtcJ